jgi:hypothetical protein
LVEVKTVRQVLVVVTLIVLIVSIAGLYISLNAVIDTWLGYKYSPIYKALLNLAVLVLAIYVLKMLLREHSESDD